MAFLLDSTVVIDVLRGRDSEARVGSLLRQHESICVSAITIDEVARGSREHEIAKVNRLFDSFFVIPIDRQIAWLAGTWRKAFANQGMTLSQPDCLIAATSKCLNATLATGNPKDFPMDYISVEHWPVGE